MPCGRKRYLRKNRESSQGKGHAPARANSRQPISSTAKTFQSVAGRLPSRAVRRQTVPECTTLYARTGDEITLDETARIIL